MALETLPKEWLPSARMTRIHVHWTGGRHSTNSSDLNAYHILIEGGGNVVRGSKSILANAPGSKMRQASHTKNANTGAIGVSMCCMSGAVEHPFSAGRHPMTRTQWNKTMEVIAVLARHYSIPVTPVTILTHAEVQPNLNIPQKNKWDIVRLPFEDGKIIGHRAVGDLMRRAVSQILDQHDSDDELQSPPEYMRLPRFRVFGVAPSSLNFRDRPNGMKKGKLPEGTLVERLAIDGHWSKVRTPRGFVGWVFSDFLRAA